jgi:hypothetical protein
MFGILISYDVDKNQTEMKNSLINKGYTDILEAEPEKINLPDTTLWKTKGDPSSSLEDMKMAASEAKCELVRSVAVRFDLGTGIKGKLY